MRLTRTIRIAILVVGLTGYGVVHSGPTIHQCMINGVRTFQDTPCPKAATQTASELSAAELAQRRKIELFTLQRQELVRELRNLTLQRQQALARIKQRRLQHDEIPAEKLDEAEVLLEAEYQQRFLGLRQRVADLDLRLERLRAQP